MIPRGSQYSRINRIKGQTDVLGEEAPDIETMPAPVEVFGVPRPKRWKKYTIPIRGKNITVVTLSHRMAVNLAYACMKKEEKVDRKKHLKLRNGSLGVD